MRRYATGAWKTELTLKTKKQTAQKLRPLSLSFQLKKPACSLASTCISRCGPAPTAVTDHRAVVALPRTVTGRVRTERSLCRLVFWREASSRDIGSVGGSVTAVGAGLF